jgi:hypothetical protein
MFEPSMTMTSALSEVLLEGVAPPRPNANRHEHCEQTDDRRVEVRRTMGMASLGRATLDNQENSGSTDTCSGD